MKPKRYETCKVVEDMSPDSEDDLLCSDDDSDCMDIDISDSEYRIILILL